MRRTVRHPVASSFRISVVVSAVTTRSPLGQLECVFLARIALPRQQQCGTIQAAAEALPAIGRAATIVGCGALISSSITGVDSGRTVTPAERAARVLAQCRRGRRGRRNDGHAVTVRRYRRCANAAANRLALCRQFHSVPYGAQCDVASLGYCTATW